MNKWWIYFIPLFFASFSEIESQNPCVSKANCGACIQTPKCAWCTQPEFGDGPTCFKPDLKYPSQCPEEFIVDPKNEKILTSNKASSHGGKTLSSGSSASGYDAKFGSGSVAQSEIKLKLRISKN